MVTVFDQEKVMEIHDYHVAEAARRDGLQEGRAKGHAEGRAEGHAEGRAEGMVEGILKALKNLMKNSGVTVDEAMSMLGISEAERFQYAEKLNQ